MSQTFEGNIKKVLISMMARFWIKNIVAFANHNGQLWRMGHSCDQSLPFSPYTNDLSQHQMVVTTNAAFIATTNKALPIVVTLILMPRVLTRQKKAIHFDQLKTDVTVLKVIHERPECHWFEDLDALLLFLWRWPTSKGTEVNNIYQFD